MTHLAMCPLCVDDEDVEVLGDVPGNGRAGKRLRHRCGFEWDAPAAPPTTIQRRQSIGALRGRFPTVDDVDPDRRERADDLKEQFLERTPDLEAGVAEYWAEYQWLFSADGLRSGDPRRLKDFANNGTGAGIGNMSVFNTAWNEMGASSAAESTRRTIDHLLRGPADVAQEDRLDQLLDGTVGFAMKGFKEALLTKVLCVVEPDRFIPILTYSAEAGGKREIAAKVYGLELPPVEKVNWTRGRLIFWSNDLLRELAGDGFVNQQHVAAFLWWAKDQPH